SAGDARFIQRTQIPEQRFGMFQRIAGRSLEPTKLPQVFDAGRLQRQDDLRKVEPFYFGGLLRRSFRMFRLRPQPQTKSRRSTARAPRALFRTGPADFLDEQRIDSAIGVVSRNPRQTAVDYQSYAVNRNGRFRDIGRNDDFPLFVLRDGSVLIAR